MFIEEKYVIDWDKVKTVEDVKRILSFLDIRISVNHPHIDEIQDYVVLDKVQSGFVVD